MAIQLHHDGLADGPILFFIHGWPDDHRVWDEQVAHFAPRWHCVRAVLPGFGAEAARGLPLPELADQLADAIRQTCEARDQERLVLVGHDWGATLSYLVEKRVPERIERMITLDVGGHLQPGVLDALMVVTYQGLLLSFWAVGGLVPPLGNALTRGVARALAAPVTRRESPVASRMNYVYYYAWRDAIRSPERRRELASHRPVRPLLYLYGLKKPMHFHSAKWLKLLEDRPDCQVQAVEAGHWLMLSRPDEVNEAMARFLEGEAASEAPSEAS